MTVCFLCKKNMPIGGHNHIYSCAKSTNISKKDIRYHQVEFETDFKYSKEYLENKYINEKWSLPDFKKYHNLTYRATQFLLSYFSIPLRTISEANDLIERKIKYKNTCKQKYGVENVSQVYEIKQKKSNTFLEHYGVDNIWKSSDYYIWLHEFMLEKYGVKSLPNKFGGMNKYWKTVSDEVKNKHLNKMWNGFKKWYVNLTDEEKNKYIQSRCKNLIANYSSSLESRVAASLTKINVPYQQQYWICRKSYDFKIAKAKIILEVNGDYWHANPEIYKENDLIKYPDGLKLASDVWKKDENKKQLAEKYEMSVHYLWESKMKTISDEELELLLLNLIGKTKDAIGKS